MRATQREPVALAQSDLFAGEVPRGVGRLLSFSPSSDMVDAGWCEILQDFWASAPGGCLRDYLAGRLAEGAVVYPPEPLCALALTPLSAVKVVILGQDPYHGPAQAEGLAFSVSAGMKIPPSLRNIFKELQRSGCLAQAPNQGSLRSWASRGVLLLNTSLTVEEGRPASHAGKGWEVLTDALLVKVAEAQPACVYMLWGGHAQAKAALIERIAAQTGGQVLILKANHPSPLSALRPPVPFVGCDHFLMAKHWWAARGHDLDWSV